MKVVVWSKYNCAYCDQAKSVLSKNGLAYEERKIGDGYTKEELLEDIPTARSVPQIVVDGTVIGGYNELLKWLDRDNQGYGDGPI